MQEEVLLKSVKRMKATSDCNDFLEFVRKLSINNYNAFKRSPHEFSDVHKGQAIAIDTIIELFDTCEEKLLKIEEQEKAIRENERLLRENIIGPDTNPCS